MFNTINNLPGYPRSLQTTLASTEALKLVSLSPHTVVYLPFAHISSVPPNSSYVWNVFVLLLDTLT